MGNWNELNIREKADLIRLFSDSGITDESTMQQMYEQSANIFAGGGYTGQRSSEEQTQQAQSRGLKQNGYITPAVSSSKLTPQEWAGLIRRGKAKISDIHNITTYNQVQGILGPGGEDTVRTGLNRAAPIVGLGMAATAAAPTILNALPALSSANIAKGLQFIGDAFMPGTYIKNVGYYFPKIANTLDTVGKVADAGVLSYWGAEGIQGAYNAYKNSNISTIDKAGATAIAAMGLLPIVPQKGIRPLADYFKGRKIYKSLPNTKNKVEELERLLQKNNDFNIPIQVSEHPNPISYTSLIDGKVITATPESPRNSIDNYLVTLPPYNYKVKSRSVSPINVDVERQRFPLIQPDNIKQAISTDIETIQKTIPKNTAVAGSSLLYRDGTLAGTPGDIDFIATEDSAMDLLSKIRTASTSTSPLQDNMGTKAFDTIYGNVDIETINKGSTPGTSKGKIAEELFETYFPEKARDMYFNRVVKDINGEKIGAFEVPVSPEELMSAYSSNPAALQRRNMLSSLRGKHTERARESLFSSTPMYEDYINKGKSVIEGYKSFSESYPHIDLSDIEQNKAFLKEIGLPEEYASNETIMRNIVERIHYDTITTRSNTAHINDKDPNSLYAFDILRRTNTALKNEAGAGGNNLILDSGGGYNYGEYTSALQRTFDPDRTATLSEYIRKLKRTRQINPELSKSEQTEINNVFKKYGIEDARIHDIQTLDESLQNKINDIELKGKIAEEISEILDMPGVEGSLYNKTNYFGAYTTKANIGSRMTLDTSGNPVYELGIPMLDKDKKFKPIYKEGLQLTAEELNKLHTEIDNIIKNRWSTLSKEQQDAVLAIRYKDINDKVFTWDNLIALAGIGGIGGIFAKAFSIRNNLNKELEALEKKEHEEKKESENTDIFASGGPLNYKFSLPIIPTIPPQNSYDFLSWYQTNLNPSKGSKIMTPYTKEGYVKLLEYETDPFIVTLKNWDTRGDLAREDFKDFALKNPKEVKKYYKERGLLNESDITKYDIDKLYNAGTGTVEDRTKNINGLDNLVISRNTNWKVGDRMFDHLNTKENLSYAKKIAILANSYHESGSWRSTLQKGNGPAQGYFMMEPPEYKEYITWLNNNNLKDSIESQVDYILEKMTPDNPKISTPYSRVSNSVRQKIDTLTSSEGLSPIERSVYMHKGYTNEEAWKDWESDDIAKTIKAFEALYERAGKPHMDKRIRTGKLLVKKYLNSQNTN